MIAAPPKNKSKKGRKRAQTAHQTGYKPKINNNQPQNNNNNNNNDNTLDLLGFFNDNNNNNGNNNNNNNNNKNNNNSNNKSSDPFGGDPFADFGFGNNNNNNNNANNNKNNNNNNNNNEEIKTTEYNDDIPKPKKKKKKKKKGRRSQTVASKSETPNVNYNGFNRNNNNNNINNNGHINGTKNNANSNNNNNNNNNNGQPQKSAVKMKKIDVLPLLHKGIRANKFKLNGNKSKVRTFYLTDTNFYFCWEAVGQQTEKKSGLFGKNKSQSSRSKIDKDRSIPIRAIKSLQKNPAYMMQSYNFIPAQQKALTLSIVYSANGQDKKLNFMAYEPFHHQLFYEGLQQLIAAARDPKRNLSEVFELYVDFPKEILPKHLRPQRFKWEPLGENDFNSNNNNNNNNNNGNNNNDNNNNNNMYFDNTSTFQNIDIYDPMGQYGRERMKSF